MRITGVIFATLFALGLSLLLASCAQAVEPTDGNGENGTAWQGHPKGRAVVSGRERYSVLPGMRVVNQPHGKRLAEDVIAEKGLQAREVVASKGNLIFFVPTDTAPGALSSLRTPEGSTLFAVVVNERTGWLGAVLGTIEVILATPGTARALALDFGLTVKRDYPHLKAAFLQVPEGGDPFAVAEALGKDPRVASAKAEVLENPPVPQ